MLLTYRSTAGMSQPRPCSIGSLPIQVICIHPFFTDLVIDGYEVRSSVFLLSVPCHHTAAQI